MRWGGHAKSREILDRSRLMNVREGPQELADEALVASLIAYVEGDLAASLRHARICLGFSDVLGMRCETSRWSWSVASRAAFELGDDVAVEELLGRLDDLPAGHVPPLLRAERELARARLASSQRDAEADVLFHGALQQLRELGSPWHLGHALVDASQHHQTGNVEMAAALLEEARGRAAAVGALPVLDRIAKLDEPDRQPRFADTNPG